MTTADITAHTPSHGPAFEKSGMNRAMAGMVLFIASEVMLFGGLFAGYFFVRQQADVWPPAGTHEVEQLFGGVLTLLLIASGFIGHIGVVAAKKGDNQTFLIATGGAIILGIIFIGGQAYEWLELMNHGLNANSGIYGSTFYLLTGFHGAHVIMGIAMLMVVFVRAYWRDFTRTRHAYADAAMLYWHFVDVVWVILYVLLYGWL